MDTPGKKLIQIGGVLFIIAGAALCVLFAISLANGTGMSAAASAVGIAAGVFQAAVGVVALVFCNKPEKALPVWILSIAVLVFQLVSWFLNDEGEAAIYIIYIIVALLLPALVIRGAYLNHKEHKAARSSK